jgi:hypothetical protein
MPLITDWLMFGITAIYVIATIFICRANIKAANASRDQIEESQKQFEETKRLECMPFLQMEISYDGVKPEFDLELPLCSEDIEYTISKIVKLKNVGNGTATTITYSWNYKGNDISKSDYPPINAIMKGDAYYILICCDANETIPEEFCGILTFQYNDLLGHSYEQKVIMHFNADTLLWCENDVPEYLGIVKYALSNKETNNE